MDTPEIADLAERIRTDRTAIKANLVDTVPAAGALDRARLRAILDADRAELHRHEGARDTAEFLAGLFHISKWKAHRWIAAAHALEHLPLTAAALSSGALSLDKTVELTRFATPASEKQLVGWARRVTVGGIRKRADVETKRELEPVQEARSARRLEFKWYDDCLAFEGLLPADQGARLVDAVDALAHDLPKVPDGTDPSAALADAGGTLDQRRADALVLLATGGSAHGSADQSLVVLHAPIEILAGDDGGCRVEGGPVLHPEMARKLACDARIQLVLEDGTRKPLGIGRISQKVPRWLRRLVFARDGFTCTFPGCEMTRFLHPHHIQHWAREGPTDLDNLVTVCTFHHDLLHEGRWSVTLDGGERPIWFRPGGRVHDQGPTLPTETPEQLEQQPNAAVAAGYARIDDLITLLDGGRKPNPDAARRAAARIRARRIPDWARAELDYAANLAAV